MYRLKYVLGLLSIMIMVLIFNGCDPVECKDCEAFDADISFWRDNSEQVDDVIEFIGDNEIAIFLLDSLVANEPFEECDITGSSDDVTCLTSKLYFYSCSELDFDLTEQYERRQNNDQDLIWVNYGFNRLFNDTIYEKSIQFDKNNSNLNSNLERLNDYEAFGINYQNVLKYTFNNVFNLSTNQLVDPKIVSELIFKEGIGIVALTTFDNKIFIRKK